MIEQTLWLSPDENHIEVIDQTLLPHQVQVRALKDVEAVYQAIKQMIVRGAPLIGATAAFGLWLAAREAGSDFEADFARSAAYLRESRPTAVNLFWAIDRVCATVAAASGREAKIAAALAEAKAIVAEDIEICYQIGQQGLPLLQALAEANPGRPINILTHCNAGMMGCLRWGTITSPIYQAHALGIPLHVWVDETRPRNQGAITAWELGQHGVPHTFIVDNTGGHLMQHGLVDIVLVGTDRTTRQGDVANKIGTYLKALAAKDNNVPFYVALPSTTLDWSIRDGLREIPIEERAPEEVIFAQGLQADGQMGQVRISPQGSPARNYGFDLTPARLITGLITERGVCAASEEGLQSLFPEAF